VTVVFPRLSGPAGLGVGLDMPWDGDAGFVRDPEGRDRASERVRRFFETTPHGSPWSHAFFSLQPRDRSVPTLATYGAAWDDAVACLPGGATRALHTTALDLGAARPKARGPLLELVNALVERHDFRWVNEDLGLWSLGDRPLPYPLPPYLTAEGLAAAIENTRACQRALAIPLLVEFPGFAKGVSLPIGDLDAYDFFRVLAEEAEVPVTLDVGHLLSWRWLRGHRGDALYDELERLPVDHCFEIHLSGCEIVDDVFYDAHHGVLLEEQLTLLDRLLELCPNACAVTYEDPIIDSDGRLASKCEASLSALAERTAELSLPARPTPTNDATGSVPALDAGARARLDSIDSALEALVFDEQAREAFVHTGATACTSTAAFRAVDAEELRSLADAAAKHLLGRGHAGVGTLSRSFPRAFEAWRERHPHDRDLLGLARAFCGAEGRRVREGMSVAPGPTIEEAFAGFAERAGLDDPASIRLALARAVARAVVTSVEPSFVLPSTFRSCPGGICTVVPTSPPYLVAALGARVVEGPVTPLIAALVEGSRVDEAAVAHGAAGTAAEASAAELVRMGLRAPDPRPG
jgi:uncharacterized protein (UPF0276 family)